MTDSRRHNLRSADHVGVRRSAGTGILYFLLVFAAGFALGIVRVLWLVPRLGQRDAELMEMPLMLAVVFFAARWLMRHRHIPRRVAPRLGIGALALALLLLTEFTLVLGLRGLTFDEYLAGRDPLSGSAYLLSLILFGLMPLLLLAHWPHRSTKAAA